MRLSRPRVLLRAVLLVVGGAFMLWKAFDAFRAASRDGGDPLLERIATVEALVGVLALVAAAIALNSLRPRRRKRTLELGDLERSESERSQ